MITPVKCCRPPGQRLAPNGQSTAHSNNRGSVPVHRAGAGSPPHGQQEALPAERRSGGLQRLAGGLQYPHAVGGTSQNTARGTDTRSRDMTPRHSVSGSPSFETTRWSHLTWRPICLETAGTVYQAPRRHIVEEQAHS